MTRSTVRAAIGTAAALGILLVGAGCGSSAPTIAAAAPSSTATDAKSTASPDPGSGPAGNINVSAKTKLFMYTFTNLAYAKSVKDQHGADIVPRQGAGFQFCVITMTIKHVPGTDDGTFGMVFDEALDASGKEYTNPAGFLDTNPDDFGQATQSDFPIDQTLHIQALYEVPLGVTITGFKLADLDLVDPPVIIKLA